MAMTIGSLFSGIGGLELGLEWAGLGPVLWQAEADRGCRTVLARHWPRARRYTDVRALARPGVAIPDIICGGFPCQDLSQANPNGRGLDGERSGLWWAMLEAIDALGPRVVCIENVSRLVRRGLDVIVSELDSRGFEVEATRLRAEDIGAPHRRERLFVVAYARGWRLQRRGDLVELESSTGQAHCQGLQRQRHGHAPVGGRPAVGVNMADPDCRGRQVVGEPLLAGLEGACGHEPLRRDGASMGNASRVGPQGVDHGGAAARPAVKPDGAWRARQAESRLGRDADGLPDWMDEREAAGLTVPDRWPAQRGAAQHEWEPPRVLPRRRGGRARLKALGNAVVPHCAFVVGMRIQQRLAEGAQ